jgi:ketosteroid isomerase-like protein
MAQLDSQHRVFPPGAGLVALASVAAILFSLCAPARAQHPRRNDQYKHQVEQLEQEWRTAELNGNVDAMGKLLSDDFVGINMSGQVVTKMQLLEWMSRRRTVLTRINLDDMKLLGQTAIVTSRAEVEGTNEGVPVHGNYRYTRVYTRTASGAWQITNFEATWVGPPFPPPPPANGSSAGVPDAPAAPVAKPE